MQSLQFTLVLSTFSFLTKLISQQSLVKLFPPPSNGTRHPILEVPAWSCQGDRVGDTSFIQLLSRDRTDKFLLSLILLNCPTVTSTLKTLSLPASWARNILVQNSSPLRVRAPTPCVQVRLAPQPSPPPVTQDPLPLHRRSPLSAQPLLQVSLPLGSAPCPRPFGLFSPQARGSGCTCPTRRRGRSGGEALSSAASPKTRPHPALLPLGETHTEASPSPSQ